MFNKCINVYSWHEIFLNLDCGFIFLFLFIYIFIMINLSKNNIQFFSNICIMLVLLTIFLFHHNAGAYAGFLFLCELISLFTIFIILNKIRCDEFIVVKKNNQLTVFVYAIVIISLFSFFKKFLNYYIPAIIPMYSLFGIGTNDFIAINYLFYANKYNIYLCICAFLIVYSSYVILYFLYVIDLYKTGNGPTFFKNYAISSSIGRVFSENNTLYFKNKISINYFKKLCLKI